MRNIFLACLLTSSIASADPDTARPRQGLELGLGLQGGHMTCESTNGRCDGFSEAGGGNVHVDYFTSPSFGFVADAWAMAHSDSGFTFTHVINTLGVKWRIMPALALQAGIGHGHATLSSDNVTLSSSGDAFAVMFGASLDVIRGPRWALSIDARFGDAFYGDDNNDGMPDIRGRNVGVGVGLAFFKF